MCLTIICNRQKNICFALSDVISKLKPNSQLPLFHKTKPPDRDLPAEVRALEVFLQKTGGPYGGWDQYDHQALLKVNKLLLLVHFLSLKPAQSLVTSAWLSVCNRSDLKVWTKHSGRPAYRKEAKLYLPAKTLEEIEQHEDWYQELLYLQDRKREVEKCGKTCLSRTEIQPSSRYVRARGKVNCAFFQLIWSKDKEAQGRICHVCGNFSTFTAAL